jgi:LuxR family maltose regulon positive regulatory protein
MEVLCAAELALLAIDEDDREEAAEFASRARAQVERCGLVDYESNALVFAVLALVGALEGRVEVARADARRSLELLDRLVDFAPWYEAETQLALARARLRLDEVEVARALLVGASRSLRRTPDAAVLRERIQEMWATIDSSSDGVASGRLGLTPAELRVLQFLPTHLSFPEIAEHLYVSANTVKTQARAVYRKLDVSSRAEAVERAQRAGLLDGERPGVELD